MELQLCWLFCLYLFALWEREVHVLQDTTEKYITCENSAKQLQDGSDYLTEQVRLYAMTGQSKYRTLYFEEANTTRRREKALDDLKEYFDGSRTFEALQEALECSQELMNTEYYSMRLVAEATEKDQRSWPEEIKNVQLSAEDKLLSSADKMEKAQQIVCDDQYQDARTEITNDVSKCTTSLIIQTRNKQGRATSIFSDMYLKLEVGIIVLMFSMSGMGLFGALTEGMSGDASVLISKSVLDFFTAVLFGAALGYAQSLICVPQLLILLACFFLAKAILPFVSATMIADFKACGGVITMITGLTVSKILDVRAMNLVPALILVMPFVGLYAMI